VLGGSGTVWLELGGDPSATRVLDISGEPDLYTLYQGEPVAGVLTLTFTPGIEAYAFTFG
jgi:hypothetical protein